MSTGSHLVGVNAILRILAIGGPVITIPLGMVLLSSGRGVGKKLFHFVRLLLEGGLAGAFAGLLGGLAGFAQHGPSHVPRLILAIAFSTFIGLIWGGALGLVGEHRERWKDLVISSSVIVLFLGLAVVVVGFILSHSDELFGPTSILNQTVGGGDHEGITILDATLIASMFIVLRAILRFAPNGSTALPVIGRIFLLQAGVVALVGVVPASRYSAWQAICIDYGSCPGMYPVESIGPLAFTLSLILVLLVSTAAYIICQGWAHQNHSPAKPDNTAAVLPDLPSSDLKIWTKADLLDRLSSSAQEIIFLVGSAVTAPRRGDAHGVLGVSGVLELIRKELQSPPDFPDDYQKAFELLIAKRGQSMANQVIRRAVLHAFPPSGSRDASSSDPVKDSQACRELEAKIEDWVLPPAVDSLGKLIAIDSKRFGRVVLTSNFDPLVEIAVKRAGGKAYRTMLAHDGSLDQTEAEGCRVVHFHGDWCRTDTLHTPAQLGQHRPMLRESLRRLLSNTTVVVIGYGGWDDIFMRTLAELVESRTIHDIIWVFYQSGASEIGSRYGGVLSRLMPGINAGRVVLYGGIDAHEFLPVLCTNLKITAAA